jgi:cell division protein FtsL
MLTPSRSAWVDAWEADLTPSPAAERSRARAAAHVRASRYYTRDAVARVPLIEERLPEEQQEEQQQRRPAPRVRIVTSRRSRYGLALATLLFSALLLGALVIAPVLISSTTTQMESQIGQKLSAQQDLMAETAALSAQISALSSPDRVAEQANRLGLGPAQSVEYIQTVTATAVTEGDTTIAGR